MTLIDFLDVVGKVIIFAGAIVGVLVAIVIILLARKKDWRAIANLITSYMVVLFFMWMIKEKTDVAHNRDKAYENTVSAASAGKPLVCDNRLVVHYKLIKKKEMILDKSNNVFEIDQCRPAPKEILDAINGKF